VVGSASLEVADGGVGSTVGGVVVFTIDAAGFGVGGGGGSLAGVVVAAVAGAVETSVGSDVVVAGVVVDPLVPRGVAIAPRGEVTAEAPRGDVTEERGEVIVESSPSASVPSGRLRCERRFLLKSSDV
jgi:hypothetical protein